MIGVGDVVGCRLCLGPRKKSVFLGAGQRVTRIHSEVRHGKRGVWGDCAMNDQEFEAFRDQLDAEFAILSKDLLSDIESSEAELMIKISVLLSQSMVHNQRSRLG